MSRRAVCGAFATLAGAIVFPLVLRAADRFGPAQDFSWVWFNLEVSDFKCGMIFHWFSDDGYFGPVLFDFESGIVRLGPAGKPRPALSHSRFSWMSGSVEGDAKP